MNITIDGLRLTEETVKISLHVDGDEDELVTLVAECMKSNEIFAGIIIDAASIFLEDS